MLKQSAWFHPSKFQALNFIFLLGWVFRFVVYVHPESALKAVEASGQLESGGRSLRLRLHFEKIPFDRPTGAKRIKCGDVIDTQPHADCWFCLANPQAEKHMVVHVGETLYTAVPKGGLNEKHILIVPIAHVPSMAYAEMDTAKEAASLIEQIRKAYHKEVSKQKKML